MFGRETVIEGLRRLQGGGVAGGQQWPSRLPRHFSRTIRPEPITKGHNPPQAVGV